MEDERNDSDESEMGSKENEVVSKKPMDFFPKNALSLNEDDIKSPALVKMLISQNELNQKKIMELNDANEKYHSCDKSLAVAHEKLKQNTSREIFSDFVYVVGGIFVSISTVDFKQDFEIKNWIFILIGIVLILGSAISKWSKK